MTDTDLWTTPDAGLKEDFDGTITYDTRWNQFEGGNYTLDLKILADDGDTVFVRGLGAGKNWVSYDGGDSIQGATSKARFHEKSGMWKWISACSKAGGADVHRAANEALGGDGQKLYAAAFSGARYHFDVVEEPGAIKQDDGTFRDGLKQVIRPTKYLGNGEGQIAGSSPASAAANGNGISESDHAQLVALAAENPTYDAFADAVLDKFAKNKAVMVALADEKWFEGLRNG